jgi:coenzyme F420-reducing hydrogenase beta subunit
MRLCSTCGAIVPMKTMSTDGYDWWCRPCMDTAYATSGYIDEPNFTP